MKVHYDTPQNSTPSVVAVGVFDGVHLGHQELLNRVVARASQQDQLATVLTFEPHPAFLLRPQDVPPLLTTLDEKLKLFEQHGIEQVVVLDFNERVASVTPDEFIGQFLVDSLQVSGVVVGEDFHFGSQRQGSVATLRQAGEHHDFAVDAVGLLSLPSAKAHISSTAIRTALEEGQVAEAASMLGRLYAIEGEVVVGDKRGRTIGFPTANIPMSLLRACPRDGVYAGWFTDADQDCRPCAINIGRRPTFYQNAEHSTLEAHLLNFDGDLYGQQVKVEFAEFMRLEQRFDGIDELKSQLVKDIAKCRKMLATS